MISIKPAKIKRGKSDEKVDGPLKVCAFCRSQILIFSSYANFSLRFSKKNRDKITMSTKDNCLSHKKDKQKSFDLGGNGCSSFNDSQYSNFNLNQTLKCQEICVITSQNSFASASFYSNDREINGLSRIVASSNILSDYPRDGSNFLNCNNTKRFWKMSDKERKKPFFDPFEDNLKHFKKKESDTFTRSKSKNAKNDSGSTKNRSTLSLHIAAYENAFEAAESGTIESLNTKMPKQNPGVMRYLPKAAAANYNLFEVPRQQEDDTRGSKDPEIMQFKASQKLLNPNDPKFQVPTTNRNGDSHQQSQQPLHQPPPQHYQHQGGPHQIIPHPHQHLYRQHQQQQQQQQFYGYPQQSYYHPNAANYRAPMPQLLQHPQPGTLLAVNEHGQPLGYVFPQHPQWNSVPQQYPAASQLRGTRPPAAAAPATEYWQQQQRPPMVMMPSTAVPSQRHQQLNTALPPQQFQGRMGSPQFYYPQPIRFPYSNQPGPSTAMPTTSQTSDYWQQRPTSMMTMMQPQPMPAPSHRRASSSAGFIPVQPRSSPVAKRRYRPPSPGLNTTAGTLNPQFQPQPSHSPIFPADSIEASAAKFLGPQKPTKKFAKDFKYTSPRQITMALQSNIHMESVWALNALTVLLYDDSILPFPLSPELLHLIVEHFWANLNLLFPKLFAFDENLLKSISRIAEAEEEPEVFWLKVVEDAKKSGEIIKTKMKLPPTMKNPLGKDLNSFSPDGTKIISKDAEMPKKLKEWKQSMTAQINENTVAEETSYEERLKLGLPSEFSLQVAEATKEFVEQICIKSKNIKFSKWSDSNDKHFEYDDDIQPIELSLEQLINDSAEYNPCASTVPNDHRLVSNRIIINLVPQSLKSYAELCLGWSNVIRGFAFNPVNQNLFKKNHTLLRIIGKLLMLYVRNQNTLDTDLVAENCNEKSSIRSYLSDVANRFRDDAFTILSFVSGSIDLFDLDSEISYPIFDALIHWTVSHSVLSMDPLVPWGIICPRDFCLESIAKMSVIDHNIDLLLSTGSWKRIEEFVRIVSDLLNMAEDTPIREFALVIMSALCHSSERVCDFAALNTNIVQNVINFLEAISAKINQVVMIKGVEYRNHEECVGTSLGMLKKAVGLLETMAQYEQCRQPFTKHINKLNKITLSQFIDPQLISQLASIVHMVQPENIVNSFPKIYVPDISMFDLEK